MSSLISRTSALSPRLLLGQYPSYHLIRKMSTSNPPWLTSILGNKSPPSKIYAWTPSNLNLLYKPQPKRTPSDEEKRIYILGVGNMGRLYATYLSKHPQSPPITLILHRQALLDTWASSPGITFTHHDITETTSTFDVEYWTEEAPAQGQVREACDGGHIPNLIVGTKASDALPQVDWLRKYLGPESTVALAQNGMNKLWPPHGTEYISQRFDEGQAPNFLHCITTHGVISLAPFTSRHASLADAKVGVVLPNPSTISKADWFMDTIASAPLLDSQKVSRADLWVLQLEKLAVNSVINPITAVIRTKNGILFENENGALARVMDTLTEETSRVYQALLDHPSTDSIISSSAFSETTDASRERLRSRFSPEALRKMLWGVGYRVLENTSSMLQDVKAGKTTEIRDFNGWIVDTARFLNEKGLDVTCHEKLIELVESGIALSPDDLAAQLLNK